MGVNIWLCIRYDKGPDPVTFRVQLNWRKENWLVRCQSTLTGQKWMSKVFNHLLRHKQEAKTGESTHSSVPFPAVKQHTSRGSGRPMPNVRVISLLKELDQKSLVWRGGESQGWKFVGKWVRVRKRVWCLVSWLKFSLLPSQGCLIIGACRDLSGCSLRERHLEMRVPPYKRKYAKHVTSQEHLNLEQQPLPWLQGTGCAPSLFVEGSFSPETCQVKIHDQNLKKSPVLPGAWSEVKGKLLSCVQFLMTPWAIWTMEFSKPEY